LSIRTNALILTADDYGYSARYNEGILEAVRAAAVDAVSAIPLRDACDPEPLLETGIEVGLHLELSEADAGEAATGVDRQFEAFGEAFGRDPSHLDGHHHCHAKPEAREAVAAVALRLGIPVRSVDEEHRATLRGLGIPTPDRVVGRLAPDEPIVPEELRGAKLPAGVIEWMVHPGHRDPGSGSSYDAAREEDLELVLDLRRRGRWLRERATHAAVLLND
jgi:predicted glycoside hydrolase/deacetylase ChbG (UPF0249 family)